MAHAHDVARVFKVLSVATRVRIIHLLKGRALCVNALAARLDVTQGAVSQHLRILRDAGLVTAEKRGYFVHYRLNHRALAKCRAALDGLLTLPENAAVTCTPNVSSERRKPCPKAARIARNRKS